MKGKDGLPYFDKEHAAAYQAIGGHVTLPASASRERMREAPETSIQYEVSSPQGTYYTPLKPNALAWAKRLQCQGVAAARIKIMEVTEVRMRVAVPAKVVKTPATKSETAAKTAKRLGIKVRTGKMAKIEPCDMHGLPKVETN